MSEEIKYYNFENTIKWLNFAYFLRNEFPFNRKDLENIKTGWGMLIIPRKGIEETIEVKLGNKEEMPLKEIAMLFQLPFTYNDSLGIISKNISLTFRYDKTYKYGEINKNIAECCYFIQKYSKRMNDFYILDNEMIFDFMSYYVINNQWGLGAETISTFVVENLSCLKDDKEVNNEIEIIEEDKKINYPILHKTAPKITTRDESPIWRHLIDVNFEHLNKTIYPLIDEINNLKEK